MYCTVQKIKFRDSQGKTVLINEQRILFKDIFFNNVTHGFQFGYSWLLNLLMISVLSIENFALFSFEYSFSNNLVSLFPFDNSIFFIAKGERTKRNCRNKIKV